MKRLLGALMVSVCLLGQTASAELFTVDDNLGGSQYLSVYGIPLSVFFNISSVIPNSGQYGFPYKVTSAYYTFTFQDDGDLRQEDRSYNTYDSYYWHEWHLFWSRRHYVTSTNVETSYYDDPEGVRVYVNGGEYSAEGRTHWYDSGVTYAGSNYNQWEDSYGDCHHATYYYWDETRGYGGSFTVTQSLGQSALDYLSDTGMVGFGFFPTSGDLFYTGGTLTVDIAPVPIAGAALLGILGLGTAGLKVRRRFI